MTTPNAYAIGAALLAALAVGMLLTPPTRWSGADGPSAPPSAVGRLLRGRPDSGLSPGQRVAVGAVLAASAGLGLFNVLGPVGVVAGAGVGCGVAVGLGWLESRAAKTRRWRLVLDTPMALDLLGAGLLAGLPLRRAVAALVAAAPGPVSEDLEQVLRQIELGVPDAEAWRVLTAHPQLGRVAADLARSVESGTMLSETLAHHARDARAERRGALEIRAREVGVRSVLPLMLCFIPSFLLLGVVPTLVSAVLNAFSF